MFANFNIEKTYHVLLVALSFLLPITVFGANFVIVVIVFLWLISGDYSVKFNKIIKNKYLIASIIFFFVHIFGLLWTEDLKWGLEIVHKMWYFVGLLPILYTLVKKDSIRTYLATFLLAIFITEILSYLIWFEFIAPFGKASVYNPIPFMSHISYNPILAVAIYIVSYEILFNLKLTTSKKVALSCFLLLMVINMFITGGRAGQIMFFCVIIILAFQYFNSEVFKALIVSTIVLLSVFFTAYYTSTIFHNRANEFVRDVQNFESNKSSSIGIRINFAVNSWEIISNNLFFGVGTGDFPYEYEKVNKKNTPEVEARNPGTTNPHNMYILVLVQTGLVGLISLLAIFFYQIKISLRSTNQFQKNFGVALPLLFMLIMLSESYLLGHYTSLLFIFFSSFLYKDFEEY
jgi:O-antigen ligase